MKKTNKKFDWAFNSDDRYISKFPRHLVKGYPEGIQHESMRASYKPYGYEINCWEGHKGNTTYWDRTATTMRWIKANEGKNLNTAFSKYAKRSRVKSQKLLYFMEMFDLPEGLHLNSKHIPIIVVDKWGRPSVVVKTRSKRKKVAK